jgi:cytochrome c
MQDLPSGRRECQERGRPGPQRRRGRRAGTYEGYHYSDANKNSGITWDEATLKEYLRDPKAKVPGTKMVFPGLKSDDDIANVIAYLKQFGPDGKKI